MLVIGKRQTTHLRQDRRFGAGREFSSVGVITVCFSEPKESMVLGHLEGEKKKRERAFLMKTQCTGFFF